MATFLDRSARSWQFRASWRRGSQGGPDSPLIGLSSARTSGTHFFATGSLEDTKLCKSILFTDGYGPAAPFIVPEDGAYVGTPRFAHSHFAWLKAYGAEGINLFRKVETVGVAIQFNAFGAKAVQGCGHRCAQRGAGCGRRRIWPVRHAARLRRGPAGRRVEFGGTDNRILHASIDDGGQRSHGVDAGTLVVFGSRAEPSQKEHSPHTIRHSMMDKALRLQPFPLPLTYRPPPAIPSGTPQAGPAPPTHPLGPPGRSTAPPRARARSRLIGLPLGAQTRGSRTCAEHFWGSLNPQGHSRGGPAPPTHPHGHSRGGPAPPTHPHGHAPRRSSAPNSSPWARPEALQRPQLVPMGTPGGSPAPPTHPQGHSRGGPAPPTRPHGHSGRQSSAPNPSPRALPRRSSAPTHPQEHSRAPYGVLPLPAPPASAQRAATGPRDRVHGSHARKLGTACPRRNCYWERLAPQPSLNPNRRPGRMREEG